LKNELKLEYKTLTNLDKKIVIFVENKRLQAVEACMKVIYRLNIKLDNAVSPNYFNT